MELSRVADYGVRAVLYLTICGDSCRTQDISEAMLVPRAYLSKVLQDLGKRDIVRLKPGVGGGVVLVADPEKLTLLDVIQTVEGRMAFNRCVYAPGECALSCSCPVHAFWNQLQKVIEEQVGGKTFAELAKGCSTESFKKTRAHSLNERLSHQTTGGEPWPS